MRWVPVPPGGLNGGVHDRISCRTVPIDWRAEKRRGGRTGRTASSTHPATWSSFTEALDARQPGGYSGIGFVFSSADDIVGIDLDKCRDERGDGALG
jgi:hypothetical protein